MDLIHRTINHMRELNHWLYFNDLYVTLYKSLHEKYRNFFLYQINITKAHTFLCESHLKNNKEDTGDVLGGIYKG